MEANPERAKGGNSTLVDRLGKVSTKSDLTNYTSASTVTTQTLQVSRQQQLTEIMAVASRAICQ